MSFDQIGWLVLLPLALLPLWRGRRDSAVMHPWLALVPRDALSAWIDWLLRLTAAAAIALTVLAMAGPHQGEQEVERIGQGAEIVVVLDRSRSMDESFNRKRNADGFRESDGADESKSAAARRIVSEFVRQRSHDAFAMVLFSAQALPILPFTQKQDVILAAIDASGVGKGLGNTDIGRALLAGVRNFDDRPYQGSRAVVLISDGGAQLDTDTRQRLATALKRSHVGVYWIYLRGGNGRKLVLDGPATPGEGEQMPEQSLHDYLSGLGLPYRVYEAERPEAVQRAVDDLGLVEQRPIVYTELLPRRDLVPMCLGVALTAVLLLLGSRVLLARRWA